MICISKQFNRRIIELYGGSKFKIKSSSFIDDGVVELQKLIDDHKKVILITGHRRENHGQGFLNICAALKEIAKNHPEAQIIYPVHLNPNVQKPVYDLLAGKLVAQFVCHGRCAFVEFHGVTAFV